MFYNLFFQRYDEKCDCCQRNTDLITLEYTSALGENEFKYCCNCARKHKRSPIDDSDLTLSSKHDLLRFVQQY